MLQILPQNLQLFPNLGLATPVKPSPNNSPLKGKKIEFGSLLVSELGILCILATTTEGSHFYSYRHPFYHFVFLKKLPYVISPLAFLFFYKSGALFRFVQSALKEGQSCATCHQQLNCRTPQ